jgi:hypothetical protein
VEINDLLLLLLLKQKNWSAALTMSKKIFLFFVSGFEVKPLWKSLKKKKTL